MVFVKFEMLRQFACGFSDLLTRHIKKRFQLQKMQSFILKMIN